MARMVTYPNGVKSGLMESYFRKTSLDLKTRKILNLLKKAMSLPSGQAIN